MIISYITIAVLIFLALCFVYYGGFKKIVIKEVESDDFFLVFRPHKGDYKDIKKVMDQVYYDLLNKNKISTTRGFGIYLDDPIYVEKENLRSVGGCIIEKGIDFDKDVLEKTGLNTFFLGKARALYTEFPFKGGFSILLSLGKVYPKLTKYFEKNSIKPGMIMEIYDIPGKKINYYCFMDMDKKHFEGYFN